MPRFFWWCRRAGRGRRRQKRRRHRRKQYCKRGYKLRQREREKYFMEQCPCASSSNGYRRQRGFPVRRPQREQPGKTCWQGQCWRSNQQQRQEHTKPLHQDQAGSQRGDGQEEMLFWNMKKHCWVTSSSLPAAMLRQASMHLRPMNMAGFCLPGMRVPHNTSQYIMDQHEFPWKNEEEVVAAMSGGSGNYSTEGEDFLLTVQEDEDICTEEEKEENTQAA